MKLKFPSVNKSKERVMKSRTQRSVSYPGLQTEANKVFAPNGKPPRLGGTGAYAVLNVGPLKRVPKKGAAGYVMEHEAIEVPITHVYLALHLGYNVEQMNFVAQAAAKGVVASEMTNKVIKTGSWHLFNRQVITPLRTKYSTYGIETVPMWFYSCPRYELKAGKNGSTEIQYSEEHPLVLIPKSIEKAVVRWKIELELQKELAILTYWIVLNRLIPARRITSLDQARDVVKECSHFLPSGLFSDYIEESRKALNEAKDRRTLYLE